MIRLAGSTDISHTTAVIDVAGHRLSRLFLSQLFINTGFAICIGLGLWSIGIPTPFLWGILAGILRFIPYIGAFIGMIFPLILAVSVDPGWSMLIWTAALFVGLETITGQVIEPVIAGHSTGLSPVAVVVRTARPAPARRPDWRGRPKIPSWARAAIETRHAKSPIGGAPFMIHIEACAGSSVGPPPPPTVPRPRDTEPRLL